jgi:hypothetical protein
VRVADARASEIHGAAKRTTLPLNDRMRLGEEDAARVEDCGYRLVIHMVGKQTRKVEGHGAGVFASFNIGGGEGAGGGRTLATQG